MILAQLLFDHTSSARRARRASRMPSALPLSAEAAAAIGQGGPAAVVPHAGRQPCFARVLSVFKPLCPKIDFRGVSLIRSLTSRKFGAQPVSIHLWVSPQNAGETMPTFTTASPSDPNCEEIAELRRKSLDLNSRKSI